MGFRYDYSRLDRKQLELAYGSDIRTIEQEINQLDNVLNNKKYTKLWSKDKYNEVYSKFMDLKALLELLEFEQTTALI
jgi:hypothetical protein